eukprot:TRINITY_DN16253_c0_g1::TRINITY_DN16253_c0_g1_i1::g.3146::m.3146 TRINITY_DN16253_c0_g1::TRINITY_DN16253_c0_g1_i1::g.3146  ORF type:complete len:105 (+),score=6.63,Methylase_S/PF01420.14/0.15 TRINITY_DN16253_c0_g1_i1:150-464(+)
MMTYFVQLYICITQSACDHLLLGFVICFLQGLVVLRPENSPTVPIYNLQAKKNECQATHFGTAMEMLSATAFKKSAFPATISIIASVAIPRLRSKRLINKFIVS